MHRLWRAPFPFQSASQILYHFRLPLLINLRGDTMDKTNKRLAYMEFYMRENEDFHAPIKSELHFYEAIQKGDITEVDRLSTDIGGKGFGTLSENPLQNLKYHLVITAALAARYCVEAGMPLDIAYSLSDLYIQQADKARTSEEINSIHRKMIYDYTHRMATIRKEKLYPKPIIECFEYVYRNLHRQFTVAEMAEAIHLTPQYLSRLFHSETGLTIMEYIRKKRIETACQMLKYSQYEATEIADFLAYASYSHFIKCFRTETGITPKQYRNRNFQLLSP